MKAELEKLYDQYIDIENKIRHELGKMEADECNCDDQEEINLVNNEGEDLGVDRLCGNCGGVIWDREL